MFQWMKLLTRSGRQELAAEAMKEYLTPVKIAELATDGIVLALDKGTGKMGEERCGQIAVGCEKGGNFCAHLGAAVNPEGENGVEVSPSEKATITADLREAVAALVTKEAIDGAIDKAVKYIP